MKKIHISLTLMLFVLQQPALANWQDWFRNKDQQGKELLAHGKPADAAHRFESKDWKGAAHYRAGHYELAAKAFKEASGIKSQYNLGNSYAYMGNYDKAIATYEDVLKKDPNHHDARHNLEIVKKLKQQAESQQKQKDSNQKMKQGQQQQQNQPDKQNKQSKNKQDDSQQKQQQQSQQDKQGNPSQQKNKGRGQNKPQLSRNELEKRQANQQWLRRIQEEPQDLLKQKFLRDYLKRRKQGGFNESTSYGGQAPW